MTFDFLRFSRGSFALTAALGLLCAEHPAAHAQSNEVNIYTYREPQLIEPMLKAFTAKSGIKTNIVFAKDGLNERLAAEGQNSPADLLLTTDDMFILKYVMEFHIKRKSVL